MRWWAEMPPTAQRADRGRLLGCGERVAPRMSNRSSCDPALRGGDIFCRRLCLRIRRPYCRLWRGSGCKEVPSMRRRARNVDNFPEDSARCNGSRRRNECRRLAATCYSRFGSTRSLPVLFGRGRVFGSHENCRIYAVAARSRRSAAARASAVIYAPANMRAISSRRRKQRPVWRR